MTSTGTVLSFFRPRQKAERDWTQEELAQFYRVEAALIRSGLLVDVDRGVSDEGDPWFIFCRQDNGEVIAHFARMREQYVVASVAFPGVARGKDFALLISDLMRSSPLSLPREMQQTKNIHLHPAAMLVALLATAFMVSSEGDGHEHHASHSLAKDVLRMLSLGEFAVLSAVAIATTWVEHQIDSGLKILEGEHSSDANGKMAEHSHIVSDIVSVLQSIVKVDADLGVHKVAAESSLGSFDHHLTDSSVSTPLLSAPALSSQPIITDKVFDVSAAASNAGPVVDLGHTSSSLLSVPDNLSPIQSAASEFSSSAPQTDHSASVAPSISQAAVSATQISAPAAQISVSSAQIAAPLSSSSATDAYHALTADLTSSNVTLSVVSIANSSLDSSIQRVLTNLQAVGANQQTSGDQSTGLPGTTLDGHGSSTSSTFDAHAEAILQQFVAANPNFEADLAGQGQQVLLVDKNVQDVANSHYGAMSWTFGDGSTLTVVGIMPAATQAAVHANG